MEIRSTDMTIEERHELYCAEALENPDAAKNLIAGVLAGTGTEFLDKLRNTMRLLSRDPDAIKDLRAHELLSCIYMMECYEDLVDFNVRYFVKMAVHVAKEELQKKGVDVPQLDYVNLVWKWMAEYRETVNALTEGKTALLGDGSEVTLHNGVPMKYSKNGKKILMLGVHPPALTAEQVRMLRAERYAGDTLKVLADRYGVSQSCVQKIAKGDSYKWVK